MVPRRLYWIAKRTAEHELRARAVEYKILEPVDDDPVAVKTAVCPGFQHHLCRADALGLGERRLNRRAVHLVRLGKTEVLRIYDSPAIHARRRDLERRTSRRIYRASVKPRNFSDYFARSSISRPSYAARRGLGSFASSSACVPWSVRAMCVSQTGWPGAGE